MLEEKSPSAGKWPWRFPPTVAGIQINHCKNPKCPNFGVPGRHEHIRRRKSEPPEIGDYTVTSAGKGVPCLQCAFCKEIFPMQSNLAVAEELLRISAYLEAELPSCPNSSCTYYGKKQRHIASLHTKYGTNSAGTPRYKCASCGKIFVHGGKPNKRQKETHLNRDIFQHLVNTVPIRRIIKLLGISTSVLYSRIEFIHRQCQLFAGERERSLIERSDLGKRYISTDRQKLLVNWSSRKERKNTVLLSIASADQDTGYVFGAHLNFDPSLTEEEVLQDMPKFGDQKLDKPFRRHARVWLESDYGRAAMRAATRRRRRAETAGAPQDVVDELASIVEERYEEALAREDIEAGGEPSVDSRTPAKGILLHEQVVMNAHIQLVCRLLGRAEKLRFFMDQESGLRAAFMSAVPERIKNRTADAFFVQIKKDASIDQKRNLVRQSKQELSRIMDAAGCDEDGAKILMALDELSRMREIGYWNDKWLKHPVSDMREPVRLICWLTDIDGPETDLEMRKEQQLHFARLYLKASLTEIDRFFMQLRRGLTMAERGVISASADRRLWFGKNAYNPGILAKLLEIFRVYFNYCEVGGDKRTPAMRLGLAKGPVAPEDILYYTPKPPPRRRAAPSTNAKGSLFKHKAEEASRVAAG